ncbi:MAG: hypothetical protein B0W54_09980 [Cellvibrio sp. 79]|nr:MAG: hypothetical protein B0W54_09980 [Cellvibrio sp. 79]
MNFTSLGEVLSDDCREELYNQLIAKSERFFLKDRSSSIPVACRFACSQSYDSFQREWFDEKLSYVVYMENYGVMVLTEPYKFLKFLEEREPWEDYDVCIFDRGLTFCVALTHNDEIKFINLVHA